MRRHGSMVDTAHRFRERRCYQITSTSGLHHRSSCHVLVHCDELEVGQPLGTAEQGVRSNGQFQAALLHEHEQLPHADRGLNCDLETVIYGPCTMVRKRVKPLRGPSLPASARRRRISNNSARVSRTHCGRCGIRSPRGIPIDISLGALPFSWLRIARDAKTGGGSRRGRHQAACALPPAVVRAPYNRFSPQPPTAAEMRQDQAPESPPDATA